VKLLIVRHGAAGKREEWEAEGRDDRLRPLTSQGKKYLRRGIEGLARLVPAIDVLATSPWTRAAETAAIIAKEYGCEVEEVEQLTADHKPEEVVPWLKKQAHRETVGLVGHEPHLSLLVGYLLSGNSTSFIDLKKGGACLVELADPPKFSASGVLQWLLSNRELRRLAK
jgi:phosphohistidine phosphatase